MKKLIYIYNVFLFKSQKYLRLFHLVRVLMFLLLLFILSYFFRCPGGRDEITPKFGDANEMMSSVCVCVCVCIYTTACEYMAQGMSIVVSLRLNEWAI